MSATVLGDTDMTQMRSYFVKPQTAIAMSFSEDPMMGMTCDRFTGSATAQAGDAVVRDAYRRAALGARRRCRARPGESIPRSGSMHGVRAILKLHGLRGSSPRMTIAETPHSIPSACM